MTSKPTLMQIKKMPYSLVSSAEKLDLIKSALADDHSFDKWSDAISIFNNSRLNKIVAIEGVRHQLEYSMNATNVTLSFKADMAQTLRSSYGDFIDVESIIKEVYGDQYPALLNQIEQHKKERVEFHDRLKVMDENSTMDDVLAVFIKVKEDLKQNKS